MKNVVEIAKAVLATAVFIVVAAVLTALFCAATDDQMSAEFDYSASVSR